jgi:GMP synthase (glutamine-hydrolysing)
MKPFVLLQTRPEAAAADNEYEAFMKFGDLEPDQLKRVRLDKGETPPAELSGYSGIMLGGGPYCASEPPLKKDLAQVECEAMLSKLMDQVVAEDFPFFGTCYGIGIVVTHQKGEVAKQHVEVIGAYRINLTEAAKHDKLLQGFPSNFLAYSGHKESCTRLPDNAVLLASSQFCPVHMFRIKQNIYVTQFHPELDAEGLAVRIRIYKNSGYFPPEDAERLIAEAQTANATEPVKILRNFVKTYTQPA